MTENKWAEIEKAIENIDSGKKAGNLPVSYANVEQKQIELKLLLSIAKSLDSIFNYGIIAYDKA